MLSELTYVFWKTLGKGGIFSLHGSSQKGVGYRGYEPSFESKGMPNPPPPPAIRPCYKGLLGDDGWFIISEYDLISWKGDGIGGGVGPLDFHEYMNCGRFLSPSSVGCRI